MRKEIIIDQNDADELQAFSKWGTASINMNKLTKAILCISKNNKNYELEIQPNAISLIDEKHFMEFFQCNILSLYEFIDLVNVMFNTECEPKVVNIGNIG